MGVDESLWDLTDYRVTYATKYRTELAKIPARPKKEPPEKLNFNKWYLQSEIKGSWEYFYVDSVRYMLFVSFNQPAIPVPFDLIDFEVLASQGKATVLGMR